MGTPWRVEKDVLYPGRVVVDGPDGRPVSHTFVPQELGQILRTGNAKVAGGWNIPVCWDHQPVEPTRRPLVRMSHHDRAAAVARNTFGAAARFVMRGDRLVAVLEGDDPDDLKQFEKVKFVSPEIQWDWRDETGRVWSGPTITHIAATPRPVQRHQQALALSHNAKPLEIQGLRDFFAAAKFGANVGRTILAIRLSHDSWEGATVADLMNGGTDDTTKGSPWEKIATALLTHMGIDLGDVSGVKDPDEFARLVDVACANYKAGGQPTTDDDEFNDEDEDNLEQPTGDVEQPPEGAGPPPGGNPPLQMSHQLNAMRQALERANRKSLTDRLERVRRAGPVPAETVAAAIEEAKTIKLSFNAQGELRDNKLTAKLEAWEALPPDPARNKGRNRKVDLGHTTRVEKPDLADLPKDSPEHTKATVDLWRATPTH